MRVAGRFVSTAALLLAGAVMLAGAIYEQQAETAPMAEKGHIKSRCREMMSSRTASMDRMKAMDQRLDELLAEMNQAKGERKIDSVARVLNEMAAQRKQAREVMMQLDQKMMTHTMEHANSGSAAMCPMMQDRPKTPDK